MTTPEFPKRMVHPGYRPAVLDDVTNAGEMLMGAKGSGADGFMPRAVPKSKPEWMPPVTVMNEDQQAWQESRGYRVQQVLAPAPRRAFAPSRAPSPVQQTPPGLDPREWPKWVEGKLCLTPSDEAKVLSKAGKLGNDIPWSGVPRPLSEEVPDPDELAEFRAWKAARGGDAWQAPGKLPPKNATVSLVGEPKKRGWRAPLGQGSPEQIELISLCRAAGLKVNDSYGIPKLKKLLDAATAPEKDHAVGE